MTNLLGDGRPTYLHAPAAGGLQQLEPEKRMDKEMEERKRQSEEKGTEKSNGRAGREASASPCANPHVSPKWQLPLIMKRRHNFDL